MSLGRRLESIIVWLVLGSALQYAIETTTCLPNLAHSKSIPKTPLELLIRREPCMRYIHVWGCLALVLKTMSDKLEPKIEVCFCIEYQKGTKVLLFYNLKDRKVFVSTNVRFLEDDYVNEFKSKSRVVLEEC